MSTKKPPYRNVWCGRYNECLSEAVKEDTDFSCKDCPFEKDQSGRPEEIDMFKYYLLLAAVFNPPAWRRYEREKVRVYDFKKEVDKLYRIFYPEDD